MYRLNLFSAIALTLVLLATTATGAPLLVDSFESGDMSATNADGFDWQRNNRTSVVTSEAAVYNNGEIYNPPPGDPDWNAYQGEHSLRFRYPAGQPMTEQRFQLGSAYKDIWFSYWIRVPTNFYHPSSSPSNNKFFSVWMDGYSSQGDGPTVWWNLLSSGSGNSDIAYSYSEGSYTVAGPQTQFEPFIRVPEDRGRWMKVVMHIKASSKPGVNDGVIELWRKWENENNYTKIHETNSANLSVPSGGPDGWAAGYILGWANAEYNEDTEWLVDVFKVSTSSLLSDDGAGTSAQPKPPTLKVE